MAAQSIQNELEAGLIRIIYRTLYSWAVGGLRF